MPQVLVETLEANRIPLPSIVSSALQSSLDSVISAAIPPHTATSFRRLTHSSGGINPISSFDFHSLVIISTMPLTPSQSHINFIRKRVGDGSGELEVILISWTSCSLHT